MNTRTKFFSLVILLASIFSFYTASAAPQSTFNFEILGHTECQDGIDNDDNGQTDYPGDGGCESLLDNNEETLLNSNAGPVKKIINVILSPEISNEAVSIENVPNEGGNFIEKIFDNIKSRLSNSASSTQKQQKEKTSQEDFVPGTSGKNPETAAQTPSTPLEISVQEKSPVIVVAEEVVNIVVKAVSLIINIFGSWFN